jgi:hypothetical protein
MCANFSKNFPFLFLTCSKMPLKIKKVYIMKRDLSEVPRDGKQIYTKNDICGISERFC